MFVPRLSWQTSMLEGDLERDVVSSLAGVIVLSPKRILKCSPINLLCILRGVHIECLLQILCPNY